MGVPAGCRWLNWAWARDLQSTSREVAVHYDARRRIPGKRRARRISTRPYLYVYGGERWIAKEIDKIKYAIQSPDAIREAIQIVSPSVEGDRYETWKQQVAESVAVQVQPDSSDDALKISVRAGGNNSAFASELIGTLQEQFHKRYHRPSTGSIKNENRERLKTEVVEALQSLDQKQDLAEKYLARELEAAKAEAAQAAAQRRKVSRSDQLRNPIASTTPVARTQLPQVEVANPEYRAIQDEITRIENQALSLQNPADSNSQAAKTKALQELRSLLKTVPASRPANGAWETNPFATQAAVNEEARSFVNPYAIKEDINDQLDGLASSNDPDETELARADVFDVYATEQAIRNSSEFRALQRAIDIAKQNHMAALDAFSQAPDTLAAASQEVELLQPPTIVNRFRSQLPKSTLWKLLIPAALAGILATVLSARTEDPMTFYSVSDTSSTLDLPVVGSITTDHGPTIQYPVKAQRPFVRWLRHGAELILVASLLTILFSIATADGFGDLLSSDPFGGFMTAVDNVRSLVLERA